MNVDERSVRAIAQIQASRLKAAGFVYVNVDGGWYLDPDVGVDAFGRWTPDPNKFPSGMRALGDYVHSLGLKFGIYVTPGIPKLAVLRNTPIEGTSYRAADVARTTSTEVTYLGGTMYSLDYAKPGSQEFLNSWANLFASWGVDYLKLDAIRNVNVPDLKAWSNALRQTGRAIHLELANDLDPSRIDAWRQYSNGWRISTDIESYNGVTLTNWEQVALRFALMPKWLGAGGPGGWNDLDSLAVGSLRSGLTLDERQTMMTFWSLAASPLLIGDDLRELDPVGIRLLTNPDVIRINQNGIVAAPLNTNRPQQVWTALQPDGSFAVGLFNLASTEATIEVSWASLGFSGPASVRDVWASLDLGMFGERFSGRVKPHASLLLSVVPGSRVLRRLAATAVTAGGSALGSSTVGPRGQRINSLGLGSTLTFSDLNLPCGGAWDLTISYVNGDAAPRNAIVSVNGTDERLFVSPGAGDWGADVTAQGVSQTISMPRGMNTLTLGNASGVAPDIIGIALQHRATNQRPGSRGTCVDRRSAATSPLEGVE